MKFHSLLLRQLKRRYGSLENVPEDMRPLLEDINQAYEGTDAFMNRGS